MVPGETRKRLARVPALQELLGLWRGDELSFGYAHAGLAQEICRLLKPSTELELLNQLYPGADPDEVPTDNRKRVAVAFRKWELERRRR